MDHYDLVFVGHESIYEIKGPEGADRGDTTIGAYLARRTDHPVEDSLAFAVALASVKMETPGPFRGRLEEVLSRMKESS